MYCVGVLDARNHLSFWISLCTKPQLTCASQVLVEVVKVVLSKKVQVLKIRHVHDLLQWI